MALDHALLLAARDSDRAFFRLYRWSPGCLSFGRNEPAASRYDRERIEGLRLDTVRRPTGGRAVWHDAELTYAVAAPVSAFGSLQASYLAIHGLIAESLAALGVPATLAGRPARHPTPDAGACFATAAGGEVVADGRKLVGSAQVRDGAAFLQHGSILLDDTQEVVHQVTRGATAAPAASSVSAALGRTTGAEEVALILADRARDCWEGSWSEEDPRPEPELVSRYSDPAWTWRR